MATVYGTIRDIDNNSGVPGASIEILNQYQEVIGGMAANSLGSFNTNIGETDKLRFSSVGYTTSTLPASYFLGKNGVTVYLFKDATLLPGITVTPKKSNAFLWIIGAVVIAKAFKLF